MLNEDLILKRWQVDLEDLSAVYKKVERQLRTELDVRDRNRLERQLEDIGLEMQELEAKIARRERELENQANRNALNDLVEILQQHEACFDEMRAAYHATSQARSFILRLIVETIDSLKIALLKIPPGNSTFKVWEEFAARLVLLSQSDSLVPLLQEWGSRVCNTWSELLEQLESITQVEPQTALLIEISYSDEAATQQKGDAVYRLQMFLIKDVEKYRTQRQGCDRLWPEKASLSGVEDETYTPEELALLTRQILKEKNLAISLSDDTEVHVFLPQPLLNCDVDCWTAFNQILQEDVPIGHDYSVVVRLHERLSRSYDSRRWKQRWQQKRSLLQKNALDVFKGCDDSDLKQRYYDLTGEGESVIGLKLLKAPKLESGASIFRLISGLGIPLAVWCRTDLKTTTNEAELDRVLGACCLESLLNTVKRERRASHQRPVKSHIGHHLSLLWDDPDLIPPKTA